MSLPTRSLGLDGPKVPAIGFGGMSLGGAYHQRNTPEEKLAVLDRAWEVGARFWDTADLYFDSEERIGDWIRKNPGKRDDVFLATKFGCIFNPETHALSVSTDPAYIPSACARSLGKLGVDTIDLYYVHRVDQKTPIEKTMEVLVELKNQNKIRHIGLSEVSANTIRRAHAVHPIAAVQVEYSLFCLDIESREIGILQTCRELGITIVPYSPMGLGLLTGQFKSFDDLPEDDFRRTIPKYSRDNFPKIVELVEKIRVVAERHGCTAAQVCLAWILAQGEDFVPIPGTRTIKYLEENTKAVDVELTKEEVEELRGYAEGTMLAGDRYPDWMVEWCYGITPEL